MSDRIRHRVAGKVHSAILLTLLPGRSVGRSVESIVHFPSLLPLLVFYVSLPLSLSYSAAGGRSSKSHGTISGSGTI